MSTKYKVIAGVVAIIVAFGFGRWSAPQSVKTETKTAETDTSKTDTEKEVEKHKHTSTTTTDVTKPDGTKEHTTTTTEDTDNVKKDKQVAETDKTKSTETSKEVTKSASRLTLSALAGAKLSLSSPVTPIYGGMVSKDVFGPISVGAFGLSSGVGGIAVGISF